VNFTAAFRIVKTMYQRVFNQRLQLKELNNEVFRFLVNPSF
jgi:hypothetical protein